MHRIDTAGHQGNQFVDADPAQGVAGTVVDDDWLNAVQEEIAKVIEESGGDLTKGNNGQLFSAIKGFLDLRLLQVDTVSSLAQITPINGLRVQVAEFWSDTMVGSRTYKWDSEVSKTNHNGGTIIDPDKLAQLTTLGDYGTYFTPAASGTGCYIAFEDLNYPVATFGAYDGGDLTQPLNAANNSYPQGSEITLGGGAYTANSAYIDKSTIKGTNKSKVTAADGAEAAIIFGRKTPDWDFYTVSNLTLNGNSKNSVCAIFRDDSPATEHLSGRWVFRSAVFEYGTIGAYQENGNIGNRYYDCHFRFNDFGAFLQNSDAEVMHAGAVIFEGCELSSNALAAIYVNDSQDGLGGYSLRDTIIEGNPGFGVFMDLNNITPYSGVNFDHVWTEANASSGSVVIDGVTYQPRDFYFKDAKPVVMKGCNLRSVQLVNSTILAEACRFDDAIAPFDYDIDADSQIVASDVYCDTQSTGEVFTKSIASFSALTSVVRNGSWRGPLKTHSSPAANATVIYANSFSGAGPWSFSGTASVNAVSVSEGVINDTSAELSIPNTYTLLGPDTGTATAGKWAVWGIHAKLVSGSLNTADLGGGGDKFGDIYLREGEWVCSYGYAKVRETPSQSRLRFINNSGASCVIRFADMYVIEFDTEQEALEFVNSRAYPK